MILVASKNKQQADFWMKEKGFSPSEWKYVSTEAGVQGYDVAILMFVGEYWKNPLATSRIIDSLVMAGNLKVVY
jgi:hypothetical protein